jgi:hypothetical protein
MFCEEAVGIFEFRFLTFDRRLFDESVDWTYMTYMTNWTYIHSYNQKSKIKNRKSH